jgi:hypothetical protein
VPFRAALSARSSPGSSWSARSLLGQHLRDLPGRLPELVRPPRVHERRHGHAGGACPCSAADGTLVATPDLPPSDLTRASSPPPTCSAPAGSVAQRERRKRSNAPVESVGVRPDACEHSRHLDGHDGTRSATSSGAIVPTSTSCSRRVGDHKVLSRTCTPCRVAQGPKAVSEVFVGDPGHRQGSAPVQEFRPA